MLPPDATGKCRGEVLHRAVELLLELQQQPRHPEATPGQVFGAQGVALVHREFQVDPRAVGKVCRHGSQDGDGDDHHEHGHAPFVASLPQSHQNLGISVLSMIRVSVV